MTGRKETDMKFTLKQWTIIEGLLQAEDMELKMAIRKLERERQNVIDNDWDEQEWDGYSDLKQLRDRSTEICWMLKKLEDEEI